MNKVRRDPRTLYLETLDMIADNADVGPTRIMYRVGTSWNVQSKILDNLVSHDFILRRDDARAHYRVTEIGMFVVRDWREIKEFLKWS